MEHNVVTTEWIPPAQRLRGEGEQREKWCLHCRDWLSAEPEFFFRQDGGRGGLFYICKACYADWRLTHPRKLQDRRETV